MIVLRNLSFIFCIAILSLSAVLVTEAQTDNTGSSTETGATTSAETQPGNKPDSAGPPNQNTEQRAQQGTRVSLQTRAQDRIIKLAANISNRFDATIGRFTHIATRLESRIAKMNGDGIDTSAATTELQTAQEALNKAIEGMSDIDTVVYEAVTSESPRATWPTVRASLRAVHTELLSTHQSLRNVVAALKLAALQTPDEEGASAAVTEGEGASDTASNEEIMD